MTKCKNCGHDLINVKDILENSRLKKEWYHLLESEGHFEISCFECKCRNPVPKKEGK